jgi:hypothetical protein
LEIGSGALCPLEQALPFQLNATTNLDFTPEGVRCTVRIPLAGAAPADPSS